MRQEDLVEIALAAGVVIMDIYGRDFVVATKADHSPVTEADTSAETLILERLQRIAPAIPVVAEESVAAGRVPTIGDTFFLVDPLDGSKEFISRNGEFTVNIALISNGRPVMGVVHAPALGRIWWGAEGQGAFAASCTDGVIDIPEPIATTPGRGNGLRVVASRSHATPELDAYLATIDVKECVAAGSSLKFCLLAEGRADLYPRFGRTMEWDTAAGDAVLRSAGGSVATLDGQPLRYGKTGQNDDADFANPDFIARATPLA